MLTRKHLPSLSDVIAACGKENVRHLGGTTYEVAPAGVAGFNAATGKWREEEKKLAFDRDGSRPERRVVMKNGETRVLKEDQIDLLGWHGRIGHVPLVVRGTRGTMRSHVCHLHRRCWCQKGKR